MRSSWLLLLVACGGAPPPAAAAPAPPPAADPAPAAETADDPPPGGDGVQVEGTLGTLDDTVVQRAVSAHAQELQGCYAPNSGGLRYVQGRVEVKVRVARDGSIVRAWIGDGDLGRWEVEKCLAGVARGMSFGKPKGGEGEVRIPLEFPSATAPGVGDPDRAQAELAGKLKALAACKGAPARFGVTVYVGPGGKVTSAGFDSEADDGISAAWGDCAARKALGWKLTDPRGQIMKMKGRTP